MGEVFVVSLPADQRSAATEIFVEAFDQDPLFCWMWPDARFRRRIIRSLQATQVAVAHELGTAYGALVDGELRGVALWSAPGKQRTPRQALAEARSALPALARPRVAILGARLLLAAEGARPRDHHWALEVLGVQPAAQGLGLGARLISEGLHTADSAGLPVALETAKRENLAWYHRFGFEQTRESIRGQAPPVWSMVRTAR